MALAMKRLQIVELTVMTEKNPKYLSTNKMLSVPSLLLQNTLIMTHS